jgi:hypothetical protein
MTKTHSAILSALGLVCFASVLRADGTANYAVQMSAVVNADPPRIELNWPVDVAPTMGYTVHRKAPGENTWTSIATLSTDATSFVDENVELGRVHEYQIASRSANVTGYGYIAVGINAPLVDSRGKVILVVDKTMAEPLAAKLARLHDDLVGDGWTVVRKDVARDESPAAIRGAIKSEYDADRERVKAVFLFGRIPIVRSGNSGVDGHTPRPMPADVFYGEMNGEWTDTNGDGIYDQNTLPSDVELQVGRVDFADLPGKFAPDGYAFPSEVELLGRYLDKDHAFRHANTRPTPRALMGNLIGDGSGQAYAASGYRTFAALLGASKISSARVQFETPPEERWISRLGAADYLWVYGCGGGDNHAVSALGTHGEYSDVWSNDFIEKKAKGTFYMLFGSWFVDWSQPDNLLRAALTAPEHGLAAAWSGRPHLFFHHMGAGETIGHGIRASQNNNGLLYQNQVQRQPRGVHIALLGDPTLRMQQLAPARELTASSDGSDVVLSWKESVDPVLGYHVYRGGSASGPFTRISQAVVGETRFVDSQRGADAAVYMVRAIALHAGASGSFYNASQGVFVTATSANAPAPSREPAIVTTKPSDIIWFDDALPPGAIGYASENDRWNWTAANPTPFSGTVAHQTELASGLHHHFFMWANAPFAIERGDTLFAYVYLDPANPPRTIMLTWCAENWEHRAFWGENLTTEGVADSASRRSLGPLPPTGRWVRLELPASIVDLENRGIIGMGFTLYDGRATWDRAGKARP